MKIFSKYIAAALALWLCAFSFAACGSSRQSAGYGPAEFAKFAKLYKIQPAEADNLVKNAKILDFGEETRLETFVNDDFAIYSKTEAGKTRYYVYDLNKEQTVPNIYSEGQYSYYNSISVYGKGLDFIAVTRTFDGVDKTAVYNKSGTALIDFTEDFGLSDVKALGTGVFSVKSSVYTVTGTTVKKIISGYNFSNVYISMLGEELIVISTSSYSGGTSLYYNLDGKLLYTHQSDSDSQFYVLSSKCGLLMTAYILPFDAKDFTVSESMLKMRLKYELVDFATGKKKEVKFNYIIEEVTPIFSLDKETNNNYTDEAQKYAFITGYEINKDKVASKIPVTLVTDASLKVICAAENFSFIAKLAEDRNLVYNCGFYQIMDKKGNTVFNLGQNYNKATADFIYVRGYYSGYHYDVFDLDGGLLINGSGYDSFSGNYGKYFAARTYFSGKYEWIILDFEGGSRKLNYIGNISVYNGFYTVTTSSATMIYNFAGELLMDWNNSGGSINFYDSSGYSSVNSFYFAIQEKYYNNTNRVLKLSV